MNWKGLAILAVLATLALGTRAAGAAGGGQMAGNPASASQAAPAAPRPFTTPRPASAGQTGAGQTGTGAQPYAPRPTAGTQPYAQPNSGRAAGAAAGTQNPNHPNQPAAGSPEDNQPPDEDVPHIAIATPAPAPSPWAWQDRIAWVANIVLVLFGCVGVYVGLSLLTKIDRQTQYAEAAAQAAALSAQAALLHAQSIVRAERPWILVTVEPSGKVENRFMVMATNRGRGPARIISAVDMITTEIDQSALPEDPDYEDAEANLSLAGVILLPGESTGVKSFGRDEVRDFCASDEKLKRVEKWEEVILLYGKIVYEDLVGLSDAEPCETAWCSWYIHGRQNSGMVMAGPMAYNHHS
jgi:hypothetical protein